MSCRKEKSLSTAEIQTPERPATISTTLYRFLDAKTYRHFNGRSTGSVAFIFVIQWRMVKDETEHR
jgi:hypothetical protein